jgi:hypothetical protein
MRRGVILPLALVGLLGCGPELAPHERPVVNIDGTRSTQAELEAYLALNLAIVEDVEGDVEGAADQSDLVRSRLLDAWIDEKLVLSEAQRRRLSIDDEQLDAHLDNPAYESGEGDRASQRAYLRNRLLIEWVQSQVLQGVVPPSGEEVLEWLDGNPERSTGGRNVRLRSLRFDSAEDAFQVHRNLRRDRLTFNEAVVQNTDDPSQGAPTIVEWSTLPPEVGQALEKLRNGWSSTPVDLGGSTYLFQVVEWIEPDPDAQIEAAQQEMISAARRTAWNDFVEHLRAEAQIRVFKKNLTFRYLSEKSG